MFYLFLFISLSISICDDVHIWISSIEDDKIELSIKSDEPIFGFDFKIGTYNNDILPIDYIEESFSNGSLSETLYTINTGSGIVSNNNFSCFTDGENRFLSLSLGNNFLPVTDSILMMTIPIIPNQNNFSYSIQDPYFFTKDSNYNIIDLDVEYGLIEYQAGWPFSDSDKILGAPAIFDINQDGTKEIIFSDYSGKVFIANPNGEVLFSFDTGNQIWSSPTIADLNNDGIYEIIISSKDQYLYVLNHNAELLMSYHANQYLLGTPAIGNIDLDSELEIIFGGYSNQGHIFAINLDGTNVPGFPVIINEKIQRGVALADLNQNNLSDIIFGTDSGNIYVLYDDGSIAFNVEVDGDIRSAPSIIKMGNEHLILVGSRDDHLYGITELGEIKFSYYTGDKVDSSPIILEYNNEVMIFFGSSNGNLYAIDTNGHNINGFPINIGSSIESSPSISDFNGDGVPEIVVSSVSNDLKIYNLNGTEYTQIPIIFEFPFSGHPIIDDIDLDGDLEIFVGTTNGMVGIDIKDINGNTEGYWNQFRNNLHRTGHIESDQTLDNINPELLSEFTLFNPYPNPFNPSTTIGYYLPESAQIQISIHDITGRKVDILEQKFMHAGYHFIEWEASDFSSGKYFVYLISDNIKLSQSVTLIK
mgnify:CR=1 FL=1